MLAFDIGQKCSVYTEHEMCVYGGRYISNLSKLNFCFCQRGQIKIWLKHQVFSDFEKIGNYLQVPYLRHKMKFEMCV